MLKRSFNGFRGDLSCLHSFRCLMFYSTSLDTKNGITNPPMIKFLVNSVGYSVEEAVSINTKVRDPSKSTKNCQLVVEFLRSSGFNDTHIRGLLKAVPNVLHVGLEKTLKPKIRVFQELGFTGSNLGSIICRHPYVLHRSLNNHIVPALEILSSVFGSNEQLVRAMPKMVAPFLLSNNVRSYLPANMLLLQSYGVPKEKIKRLLLQRPRLLLHGTQYFGELIKRVEEKLGIPSTSGMFVYGVSLLSALSNHKLELMLQVFRSYGWSETDISKLLRRQPYSLGLSEKTLRGKLKYFEDLGCVPGYLSKRPVLLTLSIEKRILPRTAVMQTLKEKKLLKMDVCVYTYAQLTEYMFVEKYVLPFKNDLPELYQYYTNTTAKSL